MISQGLPIYVALEPVDMRMGHERLGGLVRERMRSEPRSKALFVFVGKRGHTSSPSPETRSSYQAAASVISAEAAMNPVT